MAQLFIGTCSWKYDSWRGIIYSDKPEVNYLQEYSQHFNTVEIDQWFWSLHGEDKISLPLPNVVKNYNESVPDNFKFTVKIPNSITLTHFYRKTKNEPLRANPHFLSSKLFNDFLSSIEPMKKKLGPLMFQFEYLNKQKMSSQSEFHDQFGNFLLQCSRDYKYGVEIRNPNWLNYSYFNFLKKMNCGHVFLQGYYMPAIFPLYQKYESYLQDTVIVRLHGPDRKGIENRAKGKWNEIIEPQDEELAKLKIMIQQMLSRNLDVYVNVNNHYEGSAPLTIQKIIN